MIDKNQIIEGGDDPLGGYGLEKAPELKCTEWMLDYVPEVDGDVDDYGQQIGWETGEWIYGGRIVTRDENEGSVVDYILIEDEDDAKHVVKALNAIKKLRDLADTNPFCPIGHALEHCVDLSEGNSSEMSQNTTK